MTTNQAVTARSSMANKIKINQRLVQNIERVESSLVAHGCSENINAQRSRRASGGTSMHRVT